MTAECGNPDDMATAAARSSSKQLCRYYSRYGTCPARSCRLSHVQLPGSGVEAQASRYERLWSLSSTEVCRAHALSCCRACQDGPAAPLLQLAYHGNVTRPNHATPQQQLLCLQRAAGASTRPACLLTRCAGCLLPAACVPRRMSQMQLLVSSSSSSIPGASVLPATTF